MEPDRFRRFIGSALIMAAAVLALPAVNASDSQGGKSKPESATLLVDAFESFLKDQDLESFRRSVSSRYPESSLLQIARTGGLQARRAAVLGLGLTGTMKVNESIAQNLADEDPLLRAIAQTALWDLWFRADSPENNAALKQIIELNGRGQYAEAEAQATKLITQAPKFAEAHNQRAIAEFFQERFGDSARDCRRVLELNPFHTGALSGLGQCYLRLGERRQALEIYRKSLKLQPHSQDLREIIRTLEAVDA